MKEIITLRSGAKIPRICKKNADSRKYITREELALMHLSPKGDPIAFDRNPDDTLLYYFDPARVTETPPELWYSDFTPREEERRTLDSGTTITKMSARRAASCGFYTKERLAQLFYETDEEPVAFGDRHDGTTVYYYDRRTARRLPRLCVNCGKAPRFCRKLCRDCYEADRKLRRAEGDAYRFTAFSMNPARVLFFDLELTGVYDHDEIISISIVDGNEKEIMNTLVRPVHTKRWKRTEKIHGITPDMVQDAPTLEELTPRIKEIFAGADNLIAYGVSTDYGHIKTIYSGSGEQEALHSKVRCCANEFVRFIRECRPDVTHASLSDAMECFGVSWDGIPHSSIADTVGCCRVWNRLFPRYYAGQENASTDIPTYPVHLHDKAGHIIEENAATDADKSESYGIDPTVLPDWKDVSDSDEEESETEGA